jgi:hypothetical protein
MSSPKFVTSFFPRHHANDCGRRGDTPTLLEGALLLSTGRLCGPLFDKPMTIRGLFLPPTRARKEQIGRRSKGSAIEYMLHNSPF